MSSTRDRNVHDCTTVYGTGWQSVVSSVVERWTPRSNNDRDDSSTATCFVLFDVVYDVAKLGFKGLRWPPRLPRPVVTPATFHANESLKIIGYRYA